MGIIKSLILFTLGSYLLGIATVYAEDSRVLINVIQKKLHPKISKIFFKAQNMQDIEEALGKADLVENKTHFYIMGGVKYSLSITYDSNNIKRIRFRLPKSGDPYSAFSRYLLKFPKIMEGKETHSEGRYFSQTDSKQGIKLVFKNNSKKNLFSITRTIRSKK